VQTDSEIGRIYGISNGCADVAIMPDGGNAYVTARVGGPNPGYGVYNVSISDLTILNVIPLGGGEGIDITPDGNEVWVPGHAASSYVYIISTTNDNIVDSVAVGTYPFNVCISPDGLYAYVCNSYDYTISVISTQSRSVIDVVDVGMYPRGLDITPDGSKIFVANSGENTITEINTNEQEIWCDDFEGYSSAPWSSVWHGSGNVSGISIDDNIAYSGISSFKMFGIIGGCWGAVATHPIQMDLPMEMTFAVMNGDEPLSGCHPYRASFGIRTGGPDWWDCPCPQFLRFLPNGDIQIPWPAGEESEFSGFPLGVWHEIRCYLSTDAEEFLHVEIWINEQYLGDFAIPGEAWMGEPVYVDIASQEGTAWFDDICISSGVSNNYENVALDIKPQSCPNPLNVSRPKGLLPVAILGAEDFNVSNIDPSTVMLENISALRWNFEDVATPVANPEEECDCTTEGPDGHLDLMLHFDKGDIVETLGDVNNGDEIPLTLTGSLYDGTELEGNDCVIIRKKISINPRPKENTNSFPESFSISQSYPNPFNPTTTIDYALPEASHVTLQVYDILGREVETLVNEQKQTGYHSITWNASNQTSGMYFYKIQAGNFTETKKMLLLK